MNNTNKIILINRAFAISETGRVGFGFNCGDNVLTQEEWEQKRRNKKKLWRSHRPELFRRFRDTSIHLRFRRIMLILS